MSNEMSTDFRHGLRALVRDIGGIKVPIQVDIMEMEVLEQWLIASPDRLMEAYCTMLDEEAEAARGVTERVVHEEVGG